MRANLRLWIADGKPGFGRSTGEYTARDDHEVFKTARRSARKRSRRQVLIITKKTDRFGSSAGKGNDERGRTQKALGNKANAMLRMSMPSHSPLRDAGGWPGKRVPAEHGAAESLKNRSAGLTTPAGRMYRQYPMVVKRLRCPSNC